MKSTSQSSFADFVKSEFQSSDRNSRKNDNDRNYSKRDSRDSKSLHTERGTNKSLDFSVNLNFGRPTATIVDHYSNAGGVASTESITGVTTIPVLCTLPYSRDSLSATNVSMTVLYSQFREKISGRKNYNPSDLLFYTFAVNYIHQLYHHCARAVKVANKYSPVNYATPKLLLKAMGFDADKFIDDLPQWITFMDTWCNKLNAIAAPDAFPLLRKQRDMFDNIYFDNNSTKSQAYMFVPLTLGILTNYSVTSTGGDTIHGLQFDYTNASLALDIVPANSNGTTLTAIQASVNNMFTGINGALAQVGVDAALIAGDTLRVTSKYIKATPCNPSDRMPYVYDVKILQKIQNATLYDLAAPVETTCRDAVSAQSASRLGYVFSYTNVAETGLVHDAIYTEGKLVNALPGKTNTQDVCDSLELAPVAEFDSSTQRNVIHDVGFIAGAANIWWYKRDTAVKGKMLYTGVVATDGTMIDIENTSPTTNELYWGEAIALSQFDFHPGIRYVLVTNSGGSTRLTRLPTYMDIGIWAEFDPIQALDYAKAYSAKLMAL